MALAAGAVIMTLAAASAARADGPFGEPVFGQPVGPGYDYRFTAPYTWTGFYIGGSLGGGWNNGTLTDSDTHSVFNVDTSGVVGGVQAGYNYQIHTFVIGAEWEGDWTSVSHHGFPTSLQLAPAPAVAQSLQGQSDTHWVTAVSARLGVVGESWMAYFKVGGGWVNGQGSLTDLTTGKVVSISGTQSGALVGGGIAYALTANWIARVEFDYIDLGNSSLPGFVANERFGVDHSLQMLKGGFDFKF